MGESNDAQDVDDSWGSSNDEPSSPRAAEASEDGASDAQRADNNNGHRYPDDGESRDRRRPRRPRRRKPAAYEPEDERSRYALDFLSEVVEHMQMDCRVQLRRPRPDYPGDISLEIQGRDAGRIIGKKGQVLAALQFLCNRVINRPGLDRRHVTVDAEGYRHRRENSLASMARRLGKQAVTDGKIITFEPMNPRDRRVVHLALAKFEGVVTKSEGEGDSRRVQIIPVRR